MKSIKIGSFLLVLFACGASQGAGQTTDVAERWIVDNSTPQLVRDTSPGPEFANHQGASRIRGAPDVLWTYDDADAIPDTVAISQSSSSAWVGQDTNNKRLQRFPQAGPGVPSFFVPAMATSLTVSAAAAQFANLAVFAERTSPVSMRAFDSTSATPLWDVTFPAAFTYVDDRAVAVSADGTVVCCAARDQGPPESTTLFILDGATGAELNTWVFSDRVERIDLNDDGSLCLVREGANSRLIDTATGLEIFTINGFGSGGGRISGNGETIVHGGNGFFAIYKKSGSTYVPVILFGGGNQWYAEVAVSRDGQTVAALSVDVFTFLDLRFDVYDVPSISQVGTYSFSGTGAYQASPSGAQVSDDGSLIAVSHWGFQNNDHPEVIVFDRSAAIVTSLDTDGSAEALDLSANGRFLLCGSKSIHANASGRGGTVTMLEVYEPRVLHVDDDAAPGGDGLSWASAFDRIQDALDIAIAGDEIWVATGNYKPTLRSDPADPRSVTFQLMNDVSLFGGFAGDETIRMNRSILAHRTILSGDILDNDSSSPSSRSDNAYHVVTGSGTNSTAVLDGFWIERGWAADGPDTADDYGGGMRNVAGSPSVRNTVFFNNVAERGGGGMYNESGSAPQIVQSAFDSNRVSFIGGGGAMHNVDSSPVITNSVFVDNRSDFADGMYSKMGSVPVLTNSIFWLNGQNGLEEEQIQTDGAAAVINYCCIMGWTGSLAGTGNFGADPRFVDPINLDYRLRSDSPCLDAGDSTALPPDGSDLDEDANMTEPMSLDLAGRPRTVDNLCGSDAGVPTGGSSEIVDIGVFESQHTGPAPPARIYVRSGAAGAGDGSNWTDAYGELRDAIEAARPYSCAVDEIWVAEGIYTPTNGFERDASFVLVDDVTIYGGFTGTESTLSERDADPLTNNTILSGDIGTIGSADDNVHTVVTASFTRPGAVLDGLTIRDGNADAGTLFLAETSGGAVFGWQASASFRNCRFDNNRGRVGAAVYTRFEGQLTFEDCVFESNTAVGSGGAIGDGGAAFFHTDGTSAMRYCRFSDNSAPDGAGGAVRATGADIEVVDCLFEDNAAALGGAFLADSGTQALFANSSFIGNRAETANVAPTPLGGVGYLLGGSPHMVNCQMSRNWSELWAGTLLVVSTDDARITNCTINSNGAAELGGGIYVAQDAVLSVANSILWGNTDSNGMNDNADAQLLDDPSFGINFVDVSYSCVQDDDPSGRGVFPGVGNINADPQFADAFVDDVHLVPTSPCIDAASTGLLPIDEHDIDGDMNTGGPIPIDLEGMPRVQGLSVDMGVYEWSGGLIGDLDNDGDVDLNDYTIFEFCVSGPLVPPAGDTDGDGDVDLDDYATWEPCVMGPETALPGGCEFGDFDGDTDIDTADFAALQVRFNGPGGFLPPECNDADLDGDGDVDLGDFAVISRALLGT